MKNLMTVLLLAALPLAVSAADARKPLGAEARAWIDLQASGQQATGAPRPMPGEIADNVYQRYVDSFKQPIPAEFKRQAADASSNGSGR